MDYKWLGMLVILCLSACGLKGNLTRPADIGIEKEKKPTGLIFKENG